MCKPFLKYTFFLLFILICSINTSFVLGQNTSLELPLVQYDISNGLSTNVAISIHEGQKGFMWVGTYDGLNRFDGKKFKTFRKGVSLPDDPNNRIYTIDEDSNGNLWIRNEIGLRIFDPKTNTLVDDLNYDVFGSFRFMSQMEDAIFVLKGNGKICEINKDYEILDSLDINLNIYEKNSNWYISGFVQSDSKTLYLLNNIGDIIKVDWDKKEQNVFKHKLKKDKLFTSSTLDTEGNIWIGSRSGNVLKFDTRENTFEQINLPVELQKESVFINTLYTDKKTKSIWICTKRSGLLNYDLQNKAWKVFEVKVPGKKSLRSENVITMCIDSKDVMWLCSDQFGVLVHDPYLKKFNSLNPERFDDDFEIRMIRKIKQDKYGNIWIGTLNLGLWKYNPNLGTLQNFTKEKNPEMMISNSAIHLLPDGDKLYVGHNGLGITVLDIKTLKKSKHINLKSSSDQVTTSNVIWNLFKDPTGRLWIGTRAGGVYIQEGDSIKHLHNKNTILEDNTIQTIDLNHGEIILSTRIGGVYKWIESKNDFEKVYPKENEDGIAAKAIHYSSQGLYWLGTDGKGVYVLDDKFNILSHASVESGQLKNNAICSMLEDNAGNMWISTNNGLHSLNYDEDTKEFTRKYYNKFDGLTSNEFMTGAYLKTQDTLWFGTIEGLNYFVPKELKENPYESKVIISNFQSFKQSITSEVDFPYLQQLVLEPGQNAVSIEYNTLGFVVPNKINYEYRLLGYNDNWSEPTNRTFTSYTNLKPGDYTFEVKATNADGLEANESTKFNFEIEPAFWQTWWMKIIYILLPVLIIFGLYRYRMNAFKEKERVRNKYQKDISEMEMKALRAQINPHFLFNTLNSINNYIVQEEGMTASRYLVKFSQLMRNILANSESGFVTLEDELKALKLYIELEKMRFDESFDFEFNINSEINTNHVKIPSMLLQPFVENAIWHGLMHKDGYKKLSIEIIKQEEKIIKISIEDNGIGRKQAKEIKKTDTEHKSYGIEITQKRIELMNKKFNIGDKSSRIEILDIEDSIDKTTGTIVNVFIPYN